MPARDEFTEQVKKTIAERAAYLCSNPECRKLTIGPHSQDSKSLSTGVAAHICAAAPGGPRFNPSQTEDERKSISNAIWLCHECSDLVDKDERKYTKEILFQWKNQHESYILEGGGIPELPVIKLNTITGLTLPDLPSVKITGSDIAAYREHVLSIRNINRRPINYFNCRIQFPEPIVNHSISNQPAGSHIDCRPDSPGLVANVSGGGSVTFHGQRPKLEYKIAVDPIPPDGKVEFHFLSVAESSEYNRDDKIFSEERLAYHILGRFQYLLHREYSPRSFLVPLEFDQESRRISSLPVEEDDGTRKVLISHRLI